MKFRQQLIVRCIIQIDYCKLCVITQNAVDTPDNVLLQAQTHMEKVQ